MVDQPLRAFHCPKCGSGVFAIDAARNALNLRCMGDGCRFEWHMQIVGRLPGEKDLDVTPDVQPKTVEAPPSTVKRRIW